MVELVMTVCSVVGGISGTVFLGVITEQVRTYGFNKWVEYGLGTGKAADDEREREREAQLFKRFLDMYPCAIDRQRGEE